MMALPRLATALAITPAPAMVAPAPAMVAPAPAMVTPAPGMVTQAPAMVAPAPSMVALVAPAPWGRECRLSALAVAPAPRSRQLARAPGGRQPTLAILTPASRQPALAIVAPAPRSRQPALRVGMMVRGMGVILIMWMPMGVIGGGLAQTHGGRQRRISTLMRYIMME
ncbi:hypothetical protein F5148DRAFT_329291 [Russula earlei]|uniref:Uncharacterized protein n=1 Tax=Russula earlei TaxID=71964 RepID=A0ACC0U1R4_9AGAM|nr:hypothetical protein F5148DRAFT_329291 [Russula earlei]